MSETKARDEAYEKAVDEQMKKSTCRDECCDDFRDGWNAHASAQQPSSEDGLLLNAARRVVANKDVSHARALRYAVDGLEPVVRQIEGRTK